MTNDNNVKCALHPTREHPSRACTPRGFTAQFDKFQPKDIVSYEGKRYTSIGCNNKGKYVLFKETGKNVTYPIRKVTMIKQNGCTYVETN